MKKFMQDQRGAVPMLAAWIICAVATAVAAGAIDIKNPVQLEKLKQGKAEYIVNK